ncbi:hypothetical protein [Pseudonocardia acaciae]|uniref:hypothetical protein n=1 Tax=Pseudonocardia acaciae TaxID=551276 RepID=UPI0004913E05|nr:hypothetical protein [Pseudonocardia acaciae]
MAVREDLVIPQGKSWVGPTWALIGEGNTPVSLAGKTARAQIRPTAQDAQVLHEWSSERGNIDIREDTPVTVTLADGAELVVRTAAIALTVTPRESAAWSWRVGVYDLEVTDTVNPDMVWAVVEESAVRVAPEVTR